MTGFFVLKFDSKITLTFCKITKNVFKKSIIPFSFYLIICMIIKGKMYNIYHKYNQHNYIFVLNFYKKGFKLYITYYNQNFHKILKYRYLYIFTKTNGNKIITTLRIIILEV